MRPYNVSRPLRSGLRDEPWWCATTAVASADKNSSGSTYPSMMHALDGKLYFSGTDGLEYELYVYDPDTGTTTAVLSADKNGSGSTSPWDPHALDGKLYFTGTDVANERELYVYVPDDLTT